MRPLKFILPSRSGESLTAFHLAAVTVPVVLAPAITLLPNCITRGKGCTSCHFKGADLFPTGRTHGFCHFRPCRPLSRPSHMMHGSMPIGSLQRRAACVHVCMCAYMCVEGHAASSIACGQTAVSLPLRSDFFFLFFFLLYIFSPYLQLWQGVHSRSLPCPCPCR